MQSIQAKIKKTKLKLLEKDLKFLGIFSYQFNWDITENLEPNVLGCVQFNKEDLTSIYGHKISLNKNWLELPDFTARNLAHLVCHEILHILNLSGFRLGGRDPYLWNVASDHTIEVFLKTLHNQIGPYNNIHNIVPELEKAMPNCTTEQAYDWLINKGYTTKYKIVINVCGNGSGDDQQSDGNGNKPISGIIEVYDPNGKKILEIPADIQELLKDVDSTSNDVANQIKGVIANIKSLFDNLKTRGIVSGSMVSYLDKLLETKIPWNVILEKSIKIHSKISIEDRSWRRLNNFYSPHGITCPGPGDDTDDVGDLIVGVDSSGSISDNELEMFASIIRDSIKYFNRVNTFVHDSSIKQEKIFEKDDIGSFLAFIKQEGFKGRGGTSHREVFEKIEELYKEDVMGISMVILLTDSFSDIEHLLDFKWVKDLPIIILQTPNHRNLDIKDKKIKITEIVIE